MRTGFFEPDEQLPSVRSLAADAKINYNTVMKAYRDLELSSLIVSVRERGMFVQKDATPNDAEKGAIDALLESCVEQYRACGMSYREIHAHLGSVVDALEKKARDAEEEKQGYGTV